MDEIEIRRGEIEGNWGGGPQVFAVVTVHINGTDLRALVQAPDRDAMVQRWEDDVTLRSLYETRDEYLDPENYEAFLDLSDVASPSGHWLGQPDTELEEDGRAAVLTCTCRTYGCGGTAARITIADDVVTWDDFRHANSGPRVPIGPFRFDRVAYEASIAAL